MSNFQSYMLSKLSFTLRHYTFIAGRAMIHDFLVPNIGKLVAFICYPPQYNGMQYGISIPQKPGMIQFKVAGLTSRSFER